MKKQTIALAVAGAVVLTLGTAGGAVARTLVTSQDIKDNTIQSVDIKDSTIQSKDIKDGTIRTRDLNSSTLKALKGSAGKNGVKGQAGKNGVNGKDGSNGTDGKDGIAGLYYVHAKYGTNVAEDSSVGVNEGAIATVKCNAETDVAISGGVQTLGLGAGTAPAAVASSFPGRMDWTTNTPKADRLDGWIVQFDARNAPVKADLWVLCATGADVPVTATTAS